MEFLSDLFLAAAAIGAAAYCFVLSRRLAALGALEGGVGTAIAVLSGQIDALQRSLKAAQEAASSAGGQLDGQTQRAEAVARRLELLLASMHDLPEAAPDRPAAREPAAEPGREPSRWPAEAAHRPPPRHDPELEVPPTRARILRRRPTSELPR